MRWLPITICVLPILAGGCRGKPTPVGVTGTVTLDGRPIPEGTVLFEPIAATDGQRRDVPIKDGKFALPASEGVLPGLEFQVVIKAYTKTGRKYPNADMSVSYEEFVQYVPEQYNSASTLRVLISPNERQNQLTFDLVSEFP